ncbi:hypothetical protein [Natronococcus roseus]|uniref:hypothetical protein n=1 Tax=Natronococcus roseus TaxID=1052014 RepID=UPI00374D7BE7
MLRGVSPKIGIEIVERCKDAMNLGSPFGIVDDAVHEVGLVEEFVIELRVGRES